MKIYTLFYLKMGKAMNFELYMTPCHLNGFVHDQNTSHSGEGWASERRILPLNSIMMQAAVLPRDHRGQQAAR